MKEADYQKKIVDWVENSGGFAVNGKYTKAGIPDLICGVPVFGKLMFVAIEVKTPENYNRVMRALTIRNGEYLVFDRPKLKEHEVLQVAKINHIRRLGGKALFAYDKHQVSEYVHGHFS